MKLKLMNNFGVHYLEAENKEEMKQLMDFVSFSKIDKEEYGRRNYRNLYISCITFGPENGKGGMLPMRIELSFIDPEQIKFENLEQ